jgi:hypothetical protein
MKNFLAAIALATLAVTPIMQASATESAALENVAPVVTVDALAASLQVPKLETATTQTNSSEHQISTTRVAYTTYYSWHVYCSWVSGSFMCRWVP